MDAPGGIPVGKYHGGVPEQPHTHAEIHLLIMTVLSRLVFYLHSSLQLHVFTNSYLLHYHLSESMFGTTGHVFSLLLSKFITDRV